MADSKKPEDRLEKIPEPFRKVFKAVEDEVYRAHLLWLTFGQLFTKKEKVKIINETAPSWGSLTKDVFADAVALALARLTDRPASGPRSRFKNAVLESPRPLAELDSKLLDQFDTVFGKLKNGLTLIRRHRNKRIAHTDEEVALRTKKLPGYTFKSVDDALESVRDLMNAFHLHFRDGITAYEHMSVLGGADVLLDYLKLGIRFRAIQYKEDELSDEELRKRIRNWGPLKDFEFE